MDFTIEDTMSTTMDDTTEDTMTDTIPWMTLLRKPYMVYSVTFLFCVVYNVYLVQKLIIFVFLSFLRFTKI